MKRVTLAPGAVTGTLGMIGRGEQAVKAQLPQILCRLHVETLARVDGYALANQ